MLSMIGYLKGEVISQVENVLIININNVGYRTRVEKSIATDVLQGKKEVEVFTYTYVREDALDLYGFKSQDSLRLFEQLISISGIGPKIGIGVFSLGTREEIIRAIEKADTTFFTSLPKLGKKNAQKIIIELKNKVGGDDLTLTEDKDTEEILTILNNFGFTQKESREALKKIDGKATNIEDKIKLALRTLGK